MDQQQFITVLVAANSGDTAAAQQVAKFEETNFIQYLYLLCQILSDDNATANNRLMAIIQLANAVSARSTQQQKIYNARWFAQDEQLRHNIRLLLLRLLDSPIAAFRDTTVKAISAIAVAEIQQNQWQDLITHLTDAAKNKEVNIFIRNASISIIGECCLKISDECRALGNHADAILTALAVCVTDDDLDLRIAGLKALNNAIKFCSASFAKKNECTYLMQIMTKSATPQPLDEKNFSKQFQIQACAWDCLSSVVGYYYSVLTPFIVDIFTCSMDSIRQSLVKIEDEEICMATQLASIQAIEFWHSVATHEEKMELDAEIAAENGEEADKPLGYTTHALQHIAPLLFQCMCLQGDDPNDESYNITLSALNCLTMFAAQADSSIFNILIPTVESSISSPDWRLRDAALTTLGCLLASPAIGDESLNIVDTLKQAFVVAVNLVADPSDFVATSSCWCIVQYCRYAPTLVMEVLDSVVNQAFLPTLHSNRNRPTSNICSAIYELAQNISDMETEHLERTENQKNPSEFQNPLQPYFMALAQPILRISEQATNSSLIVSSYEALVALIQCKAGTGNQHLPELLPVLGQRLHASIQNNAQNVGTYRVQTQGFISAALTHLIYNLPKDFIIQQAPNLLNVFSSILTTDPELAIESISGMEAIARALGTDFATHAQGTYLQLLNVINRSPDVGALVARALAAIGTTLTCSQCYNQNIGDEICKAIFAVLTVDTADQSGKIAAIRLFSDFLAVAMDSFVRYYPSATEALLATAELSLTTNHSFLDEALCDYLLSSQTALCLAFGSLVINLGRENAPAESYAALATNIHSFIFYAVKVAQDPEGTVTTKESALILLADIFACLQDIAPALILQIAQSQIPSVLKTFAGTKGPVGQAAKEAYLQFQSLQQRAK